jgi:hypothetical protein
MVGKTAEKWPLGMKKEWQNSIQLNLREIDV